MKKIVRCRKISMVILMFFVIAAFTGCAGRQQESESVQIPSNYDGLIKYFEAQKTADSITCWYTNEEDQNWLDAAANDFEKEFGVKVKLVYYDGVSLMDDLNQASQTGDGPEVYLLGNDQLELAANSGMAEENTYINDALWKDKYPEVAKNAVTYQGKQYGYPVYFDTYCLVYDAKLLQTAPASIDDILDFLDAYEDTGSTKAVFRWDVADPYINTMFLASYANLFGENGDDATAFQINSEQSVAAMEYFQSLSAYLWMNKDNISHDTIMRRIQDGTLVLGLCKSDILPTLYEMQSGKISGNADNEGEENPEETDYKISYVPSLTKEMTSAPFSTTYNAFVNPYGADTSLGNLFSMFLSCGYADRQFAGNGKLPVIDQKDSFDELQRIIYAQYLNSKPVPKVMVLGDYLTEGGIAFDAIWSGEDAKEQLDALQTKMEEKIK
ncbi:MAG: extracellular solute-binding protein [Lachnospiraceae bacterium]|nr:extracellular solute-binding protein [Lachnospiraceae bacterium]